MRKQLLAYQISGQTVGIDITSWTDAELNGNQPFKVIISGTTIPSGYTDISGIVNCDKFGPSVANDYLCVKFQIRDLVDEIGWTGLTNAEKDVAIKYYAHPNPMDMVVHLMMTKGMTQQQAQGFVLQSWHVHHGNVVDTCKQRWFYVKIIVAAFLSFQDAEDLFDTCENLVYQYTELGRLGKDYNDNNDGIMDYLMSTHGFTGQGLEENNYTLLQGTWDSFRAALKGVLVDGIYTKY